MKTTMMLSVLAISLIGTASFAEGNCWDCGGPAFATAGAGGFAGTAMDGDWTDTFSNQEGDSLALADTDGFAVGSASLFQQTGGVSYDHNNIHGELYMQGETFAGSQVGWWGENASTFTFGLGNAEAEASGEYTEVQASLYGQSSQYSMAVDTPYGGGTVSQAEQLTFGTVYGSAHGNNLASTHVSVSVMSVAVAYSEGYQDYME